MKCFKCNKIALCGTALFRQNEKGSGIKPIWACEVCRNPELTDDAVDEVVGIIEKDNQPTH